MKKTITAILILLCSLTATAQSHSVTKFLGIPVDGTKSAMITKLKAKGFKVYYDDMLKGEFNGVESLISVVTTSGKVRRIVVRDYNPQSESYIKTRFNNLFWQFVNNSKYTYEYGETISEDENMGYEFTMNRDSYEAAFFQNGDPNKTVWFKVLRDSYNEYHVAIFYDNVYNQADGSDL